MQRSCCERRTVERQARNGSADALQRASELQHDGVTRLAQAAAPFAQRIGDGKTVPIFVCASRQVRTLAAPRHHAGRRPPERKLPWWPGRIARLDAKAQIATIG